MPKRFSQRNLRFPSGTFTTEGATTIDNPYDPQPGSLQPPQSPLPGAVPAQPLPLLRPRVCVWYNVYCAAMLLLYVAVACVGLLLVLNADWISNLNEREPEMDAQAVWFQGLIMAVISVPMMIIFILGLLTPRRPWGWGYGFVPIAIGLTSPCCMLASIPLLIFWLKPGVKRWFNISTEVTSAGTR
jgi:hypothetical protein